MRIAVVACLVCGCSSLHAPFRPALRRPALRRRASTVCQITEAEANEISRLDDLAGKVVPLPKPAPAKYPDPPTLKSCLAFALPAMGLYSAPTLMSLIDASFVGRVGTTQLAALGPASSISDSIPFFVLFLSIAATNLCSISDAAGDNVSTSRVTRTALVLGGSAGVALTVATLLFSSRLSGLYCGGQALLALLCSTYVSIRALALPAVLCAGIAQSVCIGCKDSKTPMVAVALAAVLNLAGDCLLVNGLGMGIAGAAWATVFSQYAAVALLWVALARRGLLWGGKWARGGPQPAKEDGSGAAAPPTTPTTPTSAAEQGSSWRATARELLSFYPFVFVMSIKVLMHNACAATAATLGGAPAAAHTALMAVAWLCFTMGDVGSSLAQAYLPAFVSKPAPPAAAEPAATEQQPETSQSIVASSSKEKDAAPSFDLAAAWPTLAQLLRCTATISAAVVTVATLLLTVGAGQITTDPAVQRQMRRALPLMVATLATHGTAVTLEGVLLARKDFRALGLTYTLVGLSIGAMLALVRGSGAGLLGVWAVYVWYCAVRVVSFAGLGGLLARGGPRNAATTAQA